MCSYERALARTTVKEFGSEQTKDPRYAAPTKLCDQVRVCVFHVVFCFEFFKPDEDEHSRHG